MIEKAIEGPFMVVVLFAHSSAPYRRSIVKMMSRSLLVPVYFAECLETEPVCTYMPIDDKLLIRMPLKPLKFRTIPIASL